MQPGRRLESSDLVLAPGREAQMLGQLDEEFGEEKESWALPDLENVMRVRLRDDDALEVARCSMCT